MTTLHLTENEIQEHIFNNISKADTINHIQQCKQCSLKVAQYKMMFEVIKQQSKPAFDFNITQLVMEQLPVAKEKTLLEKHFVYFIAGAVLLMLALLIYSIKNYLANITIGLQPVLVSLITTTALIISIFLIVDMYKKFKSQMNTLNYC
jgi:cell division protein FtsL